MVLLTAQICVIENKKKINRKSSPPPFPPNQRGVERDSRNRGICRDLEFISIERPKPKAHREIAGTEKEATKMKAIERNGKS